MTLKIAHIWHAINKILTLINVILFGIVTGNVLGVKATQEKNIPVIANVLLLLVLGLGLFAAIYSFR
ncbi:hypothetical protein [Pontibacter arcticus]|uniref:Uncharacterized protein n=1 Tax=Pontibacter arcticus TaxID=2080288 RepID=A0A364RIU0_9BACT|nr:hypothetical protein [Pontibacter arcticus]RAU84217.1 hypothetical protein DP923_04010 [Pontibacter arcticus]